jgi:hypothetical protein
MLTAYPEVSRLMLPVMSPDQRSEPLS